MAENELIDAPPLYFESSGRLVKLLGRESISNQNIAILELVKNAWDADATLVELIFEDIVAGKGKITVRDDGSGMTVAEIKDNWMTAATENKLKSPVTKKFNRPKLGEKGIARFGLENLSENTRIISKKEGETNGVLIKFDWTKYETADAKFEKIPNECYYLKKRKDEHGLEVTLPALRDKWILPKVLELARDIESILPPTSKPANFSIKLVSPDFPQVSGMILENRMLKNAVYKCHSKLEENGTILHEFYSNGKRAAYQKKKNMKYVCGPVDFKYYFFYREAGKYEKLNCNIDELRDFLDNWGGIKIYRDNFRIKPYGDPGNDWLELDRIRVNDPSVYPGNAQLFGFIQISKKRNPLLKDTTTREAIIRDQAFQDLVDFARDSVGFFAASRKDIEEKRGDRKKKKPRRIPPWKPPIPPPIKPAEPFLDFGKKYPDLFYQRLEGEINEAYNRGLPNAVLILCRKVAENLVYNILQTKFGSGRPDMWWDSKYNRPLYFGKLLGNLSDARGEFRYDKPRLIDRFLKLIPPFMREANNTAHYVIEYLEDKKELDKLKIPEIIDVLLQIRKKMD